MNYTRARNYRLYHGGGRVLDVELDGGRCLLGHNPRGLSTNYKNTISRGLHTALPGAIHARVVRLLRDYFPGFHAVVLPNREQALRVLKAEIGLSFNERAFSQFDYTAMYCNGRKKMSLWRPFSGQNADEADIIIPIIPQPGYTTPQAILYKHDASFQPRNFPLCSPIFLHGMYHVIDLLQRAQQYGRFGSVAKMEHQPKKHRESLGITRHHFREEQWRRFFPEKSAIWERTGPYVYVKDIMRNTADHISGTFWGTLRAEYRELKLPETADQLIILPSLASYGEERQLLSFFARAEKQAEKLAPEKLGGEKI